ncbi:MAG: TetR/AcrR family transcriptional regulator [Pseudobdellovibrionaceae bacterium]
MENNNAKIRRILHAVILLEISKGHKQWKVSDLARKVKVSRPLIYYHFGKTKNEILETSVRQVAEEFFGITPEREKMLREGKSFASLIQSRKLFLKEPAFVVFYLKCRMTESPFQKKMLETERRYQAMLQRKYPHLNSAQIKALHGLMFTIVTAPFLDEPSIKVLANQELLRGLR